jgi:hypothetical protein
MFDGFFGNPEVPPNFAACCVRDKKWYDVYLAVKVGISSIPIIFQMVSSIDTIGLNW